LTVPGRHTRPDVGFVHFLAGGRAFFLEFDGVGRFFRDSMPDSRVGFSKTDRLVVFRGQ